VNTTVDLHSSDVPSTCRETINSTWKVAVSFKIWRRAWQDRFSQHQTCKTKTQDRFFGLRLPKTDGFGLHHCCRWPGLYAHF